MNQIINMIVRQLMRRLLNKGIDAGFDKAASMRNGRRRAPQGQIDDYGNPVERGAGQNTRPRGQQGGQGARQAKQAMKMARRAGKL